MLQNHIVLYASKVVTRGTFRGLGEEAANPKINIKVDVQKVDDRKALKRLQEKKGVVATAPSIPINLIKPFEGPATQPTINGNIAWGVEAVGAHTSRFTGQGVKVAILDTGIDRAHSSFTGVNIVEEDFTEEGNGDTNGHGTHCAGTVFGRTTDNVRIGVAPGIQDVLIGKVIGRRGGSSDKIVQAINWAVAKGANIISMSLGIDFPGLVRILQEEDGLQPEPAASIALEAYRKNVLLFERLATLVKGQSQGGFTQPVLMVAAAGNESQRPNFEIAVSPPAVSDGIISVGALGKNNTGLFVADFSNTGPILSGPGVDIVSAQMGGGLSVKSGTSMATPHVAGVAALWAEKTMASNQFNINQFLAKLTGSCEPKNLPNELAVAFGAGLVQAPVS